MLLSLAGAIALATTTSAPASAQFEGYQRRLDFATTWERLDIIVTNESAEAQTLSLCPSDASRVFRTHRTVRNSAFAIKFDTDAWSFNCDSTEIAAGESLKLGMFFRPEARWRLNRDTEAQRYLAVRTSLGDFAFQDGFGLVGTTPKKGAVTPIPAAELLDPR